MWRYCECFTSVHLSFNEEVVVVNYTRLLRCVRSCIPVMDTSKPPALPRYSNLEGPFVPSGPFCGRSAIVNPDGSVVARAATLSDGGVGELIVGELELDGAKVDAWLKRNPYLATVKARLSEGFYDQLRVAK